MPEIRRVRNRISEQGSHRRFTFVAPLDFPATLRYIGRFENDRMNAVRSGTYYHVLGDSQGCCLVSIRAAGENAVTVQAHTGRAGSSRTRQIERFVMRTFGSCEDLNRFYRLKTQDNVLKRVRKKFRGLRVVGIVSLWECLAWSIIGQQISVWAAFAVRSRLSKAAGASLAWQGETYEGFPTPAQFLSLSMKQIRETGFSKPKAEYLRDIAEKTVAGELDEEKLLALPKDEIRRQLLALRGVGPWTCEYAMMRVFADPDALPLEDIGLRNAVGREYSLGRQATMKEVAQLSEAWKPFRGHATFYLWHTLL